MRLQRDRQGDRRPAAPLTGWSLPKVENANRWGGGSDQTDRAGGVAGPLRGEETVEKAASNSRRVHGGDGKVDVEGVGLDPLGRCAQDHAAGHARRLSALRADEPWCESEKGNRERKAGTCHEPILPTTPQS